MRLLTPVKITDERIVATDIPDDDLPEWDEAETYARGEMVVSNATNTVYRSLTDGNLDNDPDLETAALADPLVTDPDPVNWQVMSATNLWRLFDVKPSQAAEGEGGFSITLAPGVFVRGVAGFGISDVAEVRVTAARAGDDVIYDQTIGMTDESGVTDWYSYFFTPFQYLPYFLLTDLPPYADLEVTVEFVSDGVAKCGQLVIGPMWDIGTTVVGGTGFEGLDFSFVSTDEFGNLTRVQRSATTVHLFEVLTSDRMLLSIAQRFQELRGGVPAVWIGDDDRRKSALNYGFYRSYRPVYTEGGLSLIRIEVQGIV